MRLRFLSVLFLSIVLDLQATGQPQSMVLNAFRSKCDTLATLIQKRTSVTAVINLKSVERRNGYLDFRFTQGMGDIPWRKEDLAWLRRTLHEISPAEFAHYKIGNLYCGRTPLTQLALPAPGNDGRPSEHNWRTHDPLGKYVPIVRNEEELKYHKGLSGRQIALWQSHGYYYDSKTCRWKWQRAPLFTTVEDLYTQSYVLPFLIPMLENAGAYVMTPRERDTQKHEVIIDNDPAFSGPREGLIRRTGRYAETGKWTDAGTGFADFKRVYTGNDNPFTHGTARKAKCSREIKGNASATWTPDIPERGKYAVYVSYISLPNSTESAHYTVHHLGGASHFLVNQKIGGGTWIYLGTFEFAEGSSCYVSLDNGTRKGVEFDPGAVVTADAVKIGGGMGKIARGTAEMSEDQYTISGQQSSAEGALYWMQWAGIDTTVTRRYDNDYTNDFGDRGAWVSAMSGGSHMNPKAEGKGVPFDLSLAFHTDAGITPNDSIIGTLAIYTLICEGSRKLPDGEDRILGRVMANDIQSQVVSDLRAQYDTAWSRRMLTDRSYSESRTPPVPSMILELLSHQNFADMKYGLDPAFRFSVCRSVYKGILKFLSGRYGFHYAVQPLPVHSFAATLTRDGSAELSWKATVDTLEPTALAEGYILYTRKDDGAFDNGRIIKEIRHEGGRVCTTVPIEKGHQYSYRIAAYNAGGKSFPSQTLSLGLPENGCNADRKVLIVNNFDRVAPPAWIDFPDYAGFLEEKDAGVPYMYEINHVGPMYEFRRDKAWLDDDNAGFGASYTDNAGKIVPGNTFDYPYVHGKAIMAAGYAYCSADAQAFSDNVDNLQGFWATDIICGKQVTTPAGSGSVQRSRYEVFPERLQDAIRRCTEKGMNILISGANIGTDLCDEVYPGCRDTVYQAGAKAFAAEVLGYQSLSGHATKSGKVEYLANSLMNLSENGGPFTFNQQKNDYIYNVENPDGIAPASADAATFLRYSGSGISAGVCKKGTCYRSVCIGFPIETILDPSETASLMKVILEFFK